MVGSAATFLSYNETNVMKHLLAIEAHLRELGPNYKGEHASCVVKHLLQLEEQCEEGISHASELGLDRKAEIFREIHGQIPALRKGLEEGANPNDLIRRVREIRRKAEALNPAFNLEQCKACGVEEALAKLKIPKTSIAELEEETAHRILEHLSAKYNVPKPKLRLLDSCPTEPTGFGMFQAGGEPEIVLCRGSADVHKLAHEFSHYLQFLQNKPLSEQEAEQFALKEVAKPIYGEAPHSSGGEEGVATWREVGLFYGGQHIAKGLERGFEQIDYLTGKAAAPVQQRLSTWLNIGLSIVLPFIAVFTRIGDPWDKLLVLAGGHMSTKIWDYVEEGMAAGGGGGGGYMPAIQEMEASPTEAAPTAPAIPSELVEQFGIF